MERFIVNDALLISLSFFIYYRNCLFEENVKLLNLLCAKTNIYKILPTIQLILIYSQGLPSLCAAESVSSKIPFYHVMVLHSYILVHQI